MNFDDERLDLEINLKDVYIFLKDKEHHRVGKLITAIGKDTKTREDLMALVGVSSRSYFRKKYKDPALDAMYVVRLYPDSNTRTDQVYFLTKRFEKIA